MGPRTGIPASFMTMLSLGAVGGIFFIKGARTVGIALILVGLTWFYLCYALSRWRRRRSPAGRP